MAKKPTNTTKNNSTMSGSSSTSFDPTVTGMAVNNYNNAQDTVGGLTAYAGPMVANQNETQKTAQNALLAIGGGRNTGLETAANTAQGLAQYAPQAVTGKGYSATGANATNVNRGAVRDVSAGQLKDTDLSAYTDPWEDDVVNTSLADVERQRQIQRVNDRNSAAGAGAYGGSRHGVADSLTNEGALRASGGLAAQLRSAGFQNAQSAAFGDIDRRFGADTFNSGNDLSVATGNADRSTQVSLANMMATNQANQFNSGQNFAAQATNAANDIAGAGVRQGGAGLAATLGNAPLQDELTRAGAIGAVGDNLQGQDQASLSAAYEEYIRSQGLALAGVGALNSSLAGVPVGSTTTTAGTQTGTTKQTKDPGLYGWLLGMPA